VGIAQAIVHRPKLVILDEPISGLDPVQIVEMRGVIRALGQESTVLLSSHNLPEISQTCDRILVLHRGSLVAQGTEAQLATQRKTGLHVDVVVRGSAADLEAALKKSPLVASFNAGSDHAHHGDGLAEARIVLREDRREDLVGALVAAGLGVRRVDDTRGELEEIFLGLTQEES
jgi:ABC-2 type transport system ATP-binding protein